MTDIDHLVRVRRPQVILLAFQGTISPADWEDECIFPFLKANLLSYLSSHWTTDPEIRPMIDKMREMTFNEHFVFENTETPLIVGFDNGNSNWEAVLKSVYDYVMWDLAKLRSTPQTIGLVRKCWIQGYHDKAIQTKVFDDVLPAIKRFRSLGIKVCLFDSMSQEMARLVLSFTTSGDITQELEHFFDQETIGPRREGASYDKISAVLNVPKSDILLLCDYGQDVKISVQSGLQAVLILRPGNRSTRDYYLIRFPNASTLQQIEFAGPAPGSAIPSANVSASGQV